MQPRHAAIAAGLTLALSFGTVQAPQSAWADANIDKGDFYQDSVTGILRSSQPSSLTPVYVSAEMKYFTKYESHGDYDLGFSRGDGYNALGYYQFDRRYSLISFMRAVYNYDPVTYSMFADVIARSSEVSDKDVSMYDTATGKLTELGQLVEDAWHAAYAANSSEFSALQDAYAYNSYYAVTESWLRSELGIDISDRADCVKGMVWSVTNMCGTGGCRDFLRWANLTDDMTDREFVEALANSIIDNVAKKFASQPEYHTGWKNRYKNELKDCLVYIAEDEEQAAASGGGESDTPDADEPAADAPVKAPAGTDDTDDTDDSGSVDQPTTPTTPTTPDTSGDDEDDASEETPSDPATPAPDPDGTEDDETDGADTATPAAPAAPTVKPTGSTSSNSGAATDKDAADSSSGGKSDQVTGDDADDSDTGDSPSGDSTGADEDATSDDDSSTGSDDVKAAGSDAGEKPASTEKTAARSGEGEGTSEQKEAPAATESHGGLPKTGDVIVMASLASASLATLGATAIVHGKRGLKRDEAHRDDEGEQS